MVRHLILRLALLASLSPASRGDAGDTENFADFDTPQLLKEADLVLEHARDDNIGAERRVAAVYEAARRLAKEGQSYRAQKYFEKALQLSPWRIEYYLDYADLLKSNGETKDAERWASNVEKLAETQELQEAARKWLGHDAEPRLPVLDDRKVLLRPIICMINLGHPPDWLVDRCGRALGRVLGLEVVRFPERIAQPPSNRSMMRRWADQVGKDIQWGHPGVVRTMERLGVRPSADGVISHTDVLRVMEALLGDEGTPGQLENFRKAWAEYRKPRHDDQWDAAKLWQLAVDALGDETKRNIIWVGITDGDIYTGESNYMFGLARTPPACVVVSCARFTAEFNGEPPNARRLCERTLKQLLSSVGICLGADRPLDPTCPRSYPNGLAQHDAKGLNLCERCRKAMGERLKFPIPPLAGDPFAAADSEDAKPAK